MVYHRAPVGAQVGRLIKIGGKIPVNLIGAYYNAAGVSYRRGVADPANTRLAPAGQLGLEQVQAFAVSDDQEAQERVFATCDGHRANPTAIRRALTEGAGRLPDRDRHWATLTRAGWPFPRGCYSAALFAASFARATRASTLSRTASGRPFGSIAMP
jgi:hypothetical protein